MASGKSTIERAADEAVEEARAWLEEIRRGPTTGASPSRAFGPPPGTRITAWHDAAYGKWDLSFRGPEEPHLDGIPADEERALREVRAGTARTLKRMEGSMRWLRSRGHDLRGLADETTVAQVMDD